MIQIVLNTFDVYEIRNNLSYFVMNNAKNNDIMMKIVSKILLTKYDIEYDVVEHRLRCIDHIINLIVQTYLFDKHFNVEYRIIIDVFVAKKLNDEFQQYRKLEFQKKFHNINIYILRTSQRTQRFKNLSNDKTFKENQIVK